MASGYHSFPLLTPQGRESMRNMDRFMGVAFGSMLGTLTVGTCGSLLGMLGETGQWTSWLGIDHDEIP